MFKHFIQMLIEAKDKEDAIMNVLLGNDYHMGIEEAHEDHLLSDLDYQMLRNLIKKMA